MSKLNFANEYLASWIGELNNTTNFKEEKSVEEKLNTYFNENGIIVDSNGNFEMYVVVDANDKDHEVGSVFHGQETEVYAEKRAYEDLKEQNYVGYLNYLNTSSFIFPTFKSNTKIEKKKTIKEELLTLKDKMFKVLVNKENVTNVKNNIVFVNKYKVIESVNLKPKLKFKIFSINEGKISVLLYNSLTEKSKIITVVILKNATFDVIKEAIEFYLENDENNVKLINSLVDNGAVL